jgi:hypothetical protein
MFNILRKMKEVRINNPTIYTEGTIVHLANEIFKIEHRIKNLE